MGRVQVRFKCLEEGDVLRNSYKLAKVLDNWWRKTLEKEFLIDYG